MLLFVYRRIRDFPFEMGSSRGDYSKDLRYIMENKRGSCSPKHYLLGYLCEKMGLSVVYVTYPFYWIDQPLCYPECIRHMIKDFSTVYHLAIKVYLERKYFLLDATWDSSLAKAGFPVNEIGKEVINGKVAVIPSGRPTIHKSALARDRFIKKQYERFEISKQEKMHCNELFNKWLEGIRSSGQRHRD